MAARGHKFYLLVLIVSATNERRQGSYKKSQPFFQDFSRTKYNFQGPPTRNVISQIVYKCTFPVQADRFLRLRVFSPSPLQFSVHLFYSLLARFTPVFYSV